MTASPAVPRRLVYLGTPDAAVPPLRALVDAGFEVALVVTNADKRRGRGKDLMPSPVKAAALELGLPVSHTVADVVDVDADLGVVVAFGRLIKPDVLAVVPMINLHFSLLPRWRGAAPVERAILAGDEVTGVCVMDVEEGLDTGGVHRRVEVPIDDEISLAALRDQLVEVGSELLVAALTDGLGDAEPQSGEVTWADKLDAADFAIDWAQPAQEVNRVIRLGRAHTRFRDKRFRVHRATAIDVDHGAAPGSFVSSIDFDGPVVAAGQGAVGLLDVQPEGKPSMAASAWANGAQLTVDDRLGS